MKPWDWGKFISKAAGFFTFEWQKKLIALAISLLLFYYVNSLSMVEKTLTVPIQYRNLPSGLVILEPYDTNVSLTVKGRAEKIKSFDFEKTVTPAVNMDNALPGLSNYQVELVINNPTPDLIINLARDKVTLRVDRVAEKVLAIKPSYLGSPKTGYIMDDIIMDVKEITARGPATVLETLNSVETTPIDISDATNDIVKPLVFKLPRQVFIETNNPVNITVRIMQKSGENGRTN